MTKLSFELLPHQVPFVEDCTTPIVGFSGGMRMGKSVAAVHKALLLSAIHAGKKGMLMSPTFGMTQRNLVPIFRDCRDKYGLQIEGLGNKSADQLEVTWGNKVSTIYLQVTAENHDRMNGLTLAWAGLDEADKANPESVALAVEQMQIRCSDRTPGYGAQKFITSTPEGMAFMYDFFVEQPLARPELSDNRKLYKASMTENYLLEQEYIDEMLSTIPAHKRPAYINGDFISLMGDRVYTDYDDVLNDTRLTLADVQPNEYVWISFDLNLGGMSCVFGVDRPDGFHIIHEVMAQQDTKTLLAKIATLVPKEQVMLTCDPASTQVQPFFREMGFLKTKIMTAAPHIEWRVTSVNRKFCDGNGKRTLFVNKSVCRILHKALTMQTYVKGIPDKKTKIVEAKTDVSGPLDALGYLTYLRWPYKPTGPTSISLRGF